MPTDQQEAVATGLTDPEPNAQTSASPDDAAAPAPSTDPVNIVGLGDDLQAKVPEINQAEAVARAKLLQGQNPQPKPAPEAEQAFTLDTQTEAVNENTKRDFVQKVMEKRVRPEDIPYTPPPIPDRIAEQTRLEMQAGQRRVAEFAEQQALRPRPQPSPSEGTTKPVFRPADYVPNANQGQTPTVTYRQL